MQTVNGRNIVACAAFAAVVTGAITLAGNRACAAAPTTPTEGIKPAVAVSGFEIPTNASVSSPLIKDALTATKLSVGGSAAILYGQNAHVTVLVTCTGLPSGQTRVEVVAASTDGATADFYRKDLKARLESKSPRATPPGYASPPTGGIAPIAQYGDFSLSGQRLAAADTAMTQEGLTPLYKASGQHAAENDHVVVVVTWAIVKPAIPPPPPDTNGNSGLVIPEEDRFAVISFSTSSTTAEYYRNAVRDVMNPPVRPGYPR